MKYKAQIIKKLDSMDNVIDTLIKVEEDNLKIDKKEKIKKLVFIKNYISDINETVLLEYD